MSELRSEHAVAASRLPIPLLEIAPPLEESAATHADTRTGREENDPHPPQTIKALLLSTLSLADQIAARPNLGGASAPLDDLKQMAAFGLLTAPLPTACGGLGLGAEPASYLPFLRVLAAFGGADLVLGRLYEGHCNALVLIAAYGTPQQLSAAAEDAHNGLLFGVWNTGGREVLRLSAENGAYRFQGGKQFASGATFVKRPIVTAELDHAGWQMTLPRMESASVARAVAFDRSFWHPLGMEGSESLGVNFSGAIIPQEALIGKPGDFYRNPLFLGGAIRFAAVHAGAILRLHRMFAEWLERNGRGNDPYQIARLGEITLGAQEAVLWIERAAAVAEECMSTTADKLARERMVECAHMTRTAIERIATAMMPRVIAGIGAHGLLQPSRFERILRDLTMYLRQPATDQTLADVGRASLRKANLRADGAGNGLWRERESEDSLPPTYFQKIYDRSGDPWSFETSDYEAAKYRETLNILPRQHYSSALEVGCSIGVLTGRLAERCDTLLGLDVSDKALAAARERLKDQPHVRFRKRQIPQETIDGSFDLIVISEVAYYWQRQDLQRAATMLAEHQPPGSHLVLVHLTEPVPDYPLTGDEVHDAWLARPEWRSVKQFRDKRYRIDVLERRGIAAA